MTDTPETGTPSLRRKGPRSSADTLVVSDRADIELREEDLKRVSGGAIVDQFLKIDGIE